MQLVRFEPRRQREWRRAGLIEVIDLLYDGIRSEEAS
jgi:hypothetical protein